MDQLAQKGLGLDARMVDDFAFVSSFCQILTKTVCIIGYMITAQKNNYTNKQNFRNAAQSFFSDGFVSFRQRIAEQLSLQGAELSEDEDSTLLDFYRQGENETYVLAAFGYES